PDHPGGADQRGQARPDHREPGPGDLRRRRALPGDHRRRPRRPRRRRGRQRGTRHRRDAGAGRPVRRGAARRAAARARVPGGRAAAAGPRARPAARPGRRMIRVLVADDQALVRGSFRLLVDTAPDLEVVGEAATGAEAVEIAAREKPDVLLMDIRMPEMDGIEATRRITASGATADVRVLILTTFDLDEYVYAALRAGASGFLLKDTPPADLLAAIPRAARPGTPRGAPARIRPPPGPRPAARRDPGRRHRPGARGPDPDRPGAVQRRDRAGPARHDGHRQDPRRAAAGQARRPR